jgi:hypothetical protein
VPGPPIRAQAERPRLCQQRVPVEAKGVLHSLHTLYDWGYTVTLVRRESPRRMGLRPVRTGWRSVRGFEGRTVDIDSCHFLPLVDSRGEHQVICAYEVEEIATVARTRLLHGPGKSSRRSGPTCRGWTWRLALWSYSSGWTTRSGCRYT